MLRQLIALWAICLPNGFTRGIVKEGLRCIMVSTSLVLSRMPLLDVLSNLVQISMLKTIKGLSVGDIARDIDGVSKGHCVWKNATCQNFDAWLKTLRSLGYDVEVDDEGGFDLASSSRNLIL